MIGETLRPKTAPVVGNDLIERVDHIVEGVRLERGPAAGSAVEEVAEIVDRLLSFALLPDDYVDPEPVQRVFAVEIGAAAPGIPRLGREIELGRSIGRVLQIAPLAAGKVVELSSGDGQVITILCVGKQAAARGEHEA